VSLVNELGCPPKYAFLEGSRRVTPLANIADRSFDLAIVVDGGVERTGRVAPIFQATPTRIYVDHHKFGSQATYDHALYDPHATSTTQLVWTFFADPEIGVPLSSEAAGAIYLGLVYDTGSFQYTLTQPLTHEVAAELLDAGIDFARLHEKALLTRTFEELVSSCDVLSRTRRTKDHRITWATISTSAMRACGGDYNHVIQTLCFIEGTEVAILFIEQEDGSCKLSLRSRGAVDVARAARDLDSGGGGHERAAGCTLRGASFERVRERVIGHFQDRLREWDSAGR
jgi:phosphoesterase RecJ-like protein